MQPTGYSPYQAPESRKKISFKSFKIPTFPKFSGGFKKWLLIILGFLFTLFFVVYLCMGDLRFFANNFLRLGFFQKDYLIVFQNNYELRPGGGFITGYGEVSVTMGIPSGLSFHNSYEIETEKYVSPPYPHEELLKSDWYDGYSFRDANWNPNFPESAATLIDFYHKKFPKKDVDGIIVVNFSVIEALIGRLGGIELNGETLTQENLFKKITDNVNDVDRHNEDALAERKDILGELVGPLMSKLKYHPFKAKSVIVESMANKDIYFWFANKTLQKKVDARGWANTMTLPKNSDFLAVSLANLGSKKADRYLMDHVDYHVDLQGDTPQATVKVTLNYPGERNIYADDYKGYLRLYLPPGAEILSETKDLKVEKEGDFKVIGTVVNLKAEETKAFSFKYQLPRNILTNDNYQLKVIKQSGDKKYYTISLEGNDDHGMEVLNRHSDDSSLDFLVKENKAFWQGTLKNDLNLNLKLLEDVTAPYPVEQGFDSLKMLSIYWNEAISPSSGTDISNYKIIDLDKTDKEQTDTIKITKAKIVGETITQLEIEGVTQQDLERYQIIMKGIKDVSNNTIDPDPKIITAVQRIK